MYWGVGLLPYTAAPGAVPVYLRFAVLHVYDGVQTTESAPMTAVWRFWLCSCSAFYSQFQVSGRMSWLDGPVLSVLSPSTLENTFYCLLVALSNNLKYGVKTTAAVRTLVSDLEISISRVHSRGVPLVINRSIPVGNWASALFATK